MAFLFNIVVYFLLKKITIYYTKIIVILSYKKNFICNSSQGKDYVYEIAE